MKPIDKKTHQLKSDVKGYGKKFNSGGYLLYSGTN